MLTEPISIVIVESQPLMRAALSMAFASEGATVLAVLDGSLEAECTAPKLNPNVVLLAVGTPGWSDMEVIVTLRKRMPAAVIVALVTGEIPGQAHTALKKGADLVLSKSTPRSELLNAVSEISRNRLYTASIQAD